jgi:hypothetical protein
MESLAKGNTIFVEVAQRQRKLVAVITKSVSFRACNEKRKQLKKKSLITLPIYNLNCFSQLAQLLYYLSSQLFRLIAI